MVGRRRVAIDDATRDPHKPSPPGPTSFSERPPGLPKKWGREFTLVRFILSFDRKVEWPSSITRPASCRVGVLQYGFLKDYY